MSCGGVFCGRVSCDSVSCANWTYWMCELNLIIQDDEAAFESFFSNEVLHKSCCTALRNQKCPHYWPHSWSSEGASFNFPCTIFGLCAFPTFWLANLSLAWQYSVNKPINIFKQNKILIHIRLFIYFKIVILNETGSRVARKAAASWGDEDRQHHVLFIRLLDLAIILLLEL